MNRIQSFDETLNRLLLHFKDIPYKDIERSHIGEALFILLCDKEKIEDPIYLSDVDFTFEDALILLKDFDFNILLEKVETSTNILPNMFLKNYKARIKNNNIVWVIHRYDADPFPSNPHAHNIDNNIKLDLSNGQCYQNKKKIHTINKKELLEIRSKAEKVYTGKLPSIQE